MMKTNIHLPHLFFHRQGRGKHISNDHFHCSVKYADIYWWFHSLGNSLLFFKATKYYRSPQETLWWRALGLRCDWFPLRCTPRHIPTSCRETLSVCQQPNQTTLQRNLGKTTKVQTWSIMIFVKSVITTKYISRCQQVLGKTEESRDLCGRGDTPSTRHLAQRSVQSNAVPFHDKWPNSPLKWQHCLNFTGSLWCLCSARWTGIHRIHFALSINIVFGKTSTFVMRLHPLPGLISMPSIEYFRNIYVGYPVLSLDWRKKLHWKQGRGSCKIYLTCHNGNVAALAEFRPLVDMATFCSADNRRDRETVNDVTRHTSTPHPPSGPNYVKFARRLLFSEQNCPSKCLTDGMIPAECIRPGVQTASATIPRVISS